MLRSTLAVLATIALALPAFAQGAAFRDTFYIPVFPINTTTFEVVEADGAGGTQMWCAAGLYARNSLGQADAELYILKGLGDSQALPGRESVVFTTQTVENAFHTMTQGVRRAGLTFSVSHAHALCGDATRLRINVSQSGS